MNELFTLNLCRVLAHSTVFFTRADWSVDMRCEDKAQSTTKIDAQRLYGALKEYLPGISQLFNEQILPGEQAQLGAAENISPRYYDLLTKLQTEYGPALARSGAGIDAAARQAGAENDLSFLQGTGGDLLTQIDSQNKQLNPEFYRTRDSTSQALQQLLGSINLGDANPEAERLVNQENVRSGTLATPSATNTTKNALSFGNELQKRRDALSSAISTATNFLAPASVGVDSSAVLNAGKQNPGTANFTGVVNPTNEGLNTARGYLDNLTGLRAVNTQGNYQKRDWIDRVNEGFGSL